MPSSFTYLSGASSDYNHQNVLIAPEAPETRETAVHAEAVAILLGRGLSFRTKMTPMKPGSRSDNVHHYSGLMESENSHHHAHQHELVHGVHPNMYSPEPYQAQHLSSFDRLPELEEYTYTDSALNQPLGSSDLFLPPTSQLQLADFELDPVRTAPTSYPHYPHFSTQPQYNPGFTGLSLMAYPGAPISPPNSTYHYYDEGSVTTPWSSPEYMSCGPMSSVDDEDEMIDDKPYARLIYEALMQAPGHRMMLREIYDWFRHNTSKAQDNGTNGWQNSIRHNLSMNKVCSNGQGFLAILIVVQAFENDREQSRGNSRKANSVWLLTEDAIQNGVQSTTRYRKTGGGKRPLGTRTPAYQRQKSGAKGARAARQVTKIRRRGQNLLEHPSPSSCSPGTPSYSDLSDYGFDNHDYHPTFSSCPLTPVEGHAHTMSNTMHHMYLPTTTSEDYVLQNTSFVGDDPMQLQSLLLHSTPDQYVEGMGDLKMD